MPITQTKETELAKETELEPGVTAICYEGTPLPECFSIEDRLSFYFSKDRQGWLAGQMKQAAKAGDDEKIKALSLHIEENKDQFKPV